VLVLNSPMQAIELIGRVLLERGLEGILFATVRNAEV
jgi:hypothetical protein